ncbi:hypothetical protein B0H66DRAFT_541693 [Apodospora peruviana]|uniref:Uncharacterized protein n=1 Tax=Apodospora peruviana TaxID=516989 RepID=A0AAE0MEJ3_9PEZI|nr:hypothetical protein B0H66DRAFT_541693 [Apodospora peruviana]
MKSVTCRIFLFIPPPPLLFESCKAANTQTHIHTNRRCDAWQTCFRSGGTGVSSIPGYRKVVYWKKDERHRGHTYLNYLSARSDSGRLVCLCAPLVHWVPLGV